MQLQLVVFGTRTATRALKASLKPPRRMTDAPKQGVGDRKWVRHAAFTTGRHLTRPSQDATTSTRTLAGQLDALARIGPPRAAPLPPRRTRRPPPSGEGGVVAQRGQARASEVPPPSDQRQPCSGAGETALEPVLTTRLAPVAASPSRRHPQRCASALEGLQPLW